jgi:sec-independent protein translocase protein TatB
MFDVGFAELLIIAVVALFVLGPERLPKAARFTGLWVRKARAQWYAVKSELELELAQDEMKKHLQSVENSIKAPMQDLQQDLQQTESDIQRGLDEAVTGDVPVPADREAPKRYNVFADGSGTPDPEQGGGSPTTDEPEIGQARTAQPENPAETKPEADERDAAPPKQGALW